MLKIKNLDLSKLPWINWLDPLRQVNQSLDSSTLKFLELSKIDRNWKKPVLIKNMSTEFFEKKNKIKQIFEKDSNGIIYAGLCTILTDNLIKDLFNHLQEIKYKKLKSKVTILALGGYGRGELAPKSDIDLLFLVDNQSSSKTNIFSSEKFIEEVLYFFWDLGFSVGHSTRTIKETFDFAKQDLTFLTSLIDHRLLAGEVKIFEEFQKFYQTFLKNYNTFEFIKRKLDEANKRHEKYGASRFLVEPNVKEGKGGIRDIQTLVWISKFAYNSKKIHNLIEKGLFLKKELYTLSSSYKFMLSTRCYLHLLSNRENDNLDTESQIEISKIMRFRRAEFQRPVERFMKRYYIATKNIGSLTRIFFSVIEDEFNTSIRFNFFFRKWLNLKIPYRFKNRKIAIDNKQDIIENPQLIIEIFNISHFKKLEIHPETLRYISDCSKLIRKKQINCTVNNKLILEIMSSKFNCRPILRLMNDTNVLGNFIPEFKKIIGLIQHDMYHHYTVDEHTFFAISNAYKLKKEKTKYPLKLEESIMLSINRFDLLIISLFLHDIAKGEGGDHSKNGYKIAKKLCPRLGLSKKDTNIVSWLVLHHLLLSETAFRYDLNDFKIIKSCSQKIKSLEKLNMLYLLTICDIKAVGPGVWNDWKGSLLNDLYNKIKRYICFDDFEKITTQKNHKHIKLMQELKNSKILNSDEARKYITKFPTSYWSMFDVKQMLHQAKLFKKMLASNLKFIFDINNNDVSNVSELIVIAPDNFGLFSKISGILSSSNINVISAKIITRSDGYAIDYFVVNNKIEMAIKEKNLQQKIFTKLKDGLEGIYNFEVELKKRLNEVPSKIKKITAPIRVFVDNETSNDFTIIEVNCKNAPGVLFQITRCISYLNIQIFNASISTYGTRVTDIFYVKDLFGQKILDLNKIQNIKSQLYEVLDNRL